MNDEWETPLDLFDNLNDEFNFEVDLCANAENSRCGLGVTDIKSYIEGWDLDGCTRFWMNPPYSRPKIAMCMEYAYDLSKADNLVVCLVRFDPSAKWFQNWVDGKASEVRMLDRRVKFQGAPSAYNFPCCLVVYAAPTHWHGLPVIPTKYHIWGWK